MKAHSSFRGNSFACWLALALLTALASVGLSAPTLPPREVSLWVARDVAPSPKVRVTLNTRNVSSVTMAAYRLEPISWLIRRSRLDSEPEPHRRPSVSGAPIKSWTVGMQQRGERTNPAQADQYRSRQVNLPPLPPGVYLLTASGGGKEAWGVVNVTRLAVVVKRSPHKLLAWVTDFGTGATLGGAKVSLYSPKAARLAEGSTVGNGVCVLPTRPGAEETLIVRRGNDVAGVPTAVEDPNGALRMLFQTDRPIYRPGNTVQFKAVLRRTSGAGYVPVTATACRVQVRDAKDNPIDELSLTTNAVGSLSGEIELPAEGVPGPYSVVVSLGKENAYGSFSVAEYRKPEFKVTVRSVAPRYLAGEEAAFELEAAYYFGAPLPQAAVRYQIRRTATPFSAGESGESWYSGGDGNLYARDTYAADPFVAEGTVYTDDAGKVRIPFKTAPKTPDTSYSITCTVTDSGRRQVEASASVPAYPATLRLGLRTEASLAPLGSVMPVEVAVADLDGKPSAALVTLVVRRPVWRPAKGEYETVVVTRTQVRVPTSGKARATVPAAAEGDLTVLATVTDNTGRSTTAETGFWVVGADWKPEKDATEPTINLRADRTRYRPGETARLWMSRNTRGRPALLTLEGRELWEYAVLPAARLGYLWTVKTSLPMSPNAYASAAQWSAHGLLSANALLPIPDSSRSLKVQVESEREGYRPGEEARYRIRTTDAAGKGIPAEVALGVVDEAIYALRADSTPDPFTFFWGLRPNLVQTAQSAPEEVSGGAYQRNNPLAPVRERFQDTAFWQPHVQTGADGTATVSFPFPGNLTAWRATALAVTGDTRVGRATAQVRVSRPVMLRLAPPRQMAQGDHFTLVGTIHNRTEREREFEALLRPEFVALEGPATHRVRVPGGGEAKVEWRLQAPTLPEGGAARLFGQVVALDAPAAERADLSDALRISVPVVPRGVQERRAVSATVAREGELSLEFPEDRLEPATRVSLIVRAGLGAAVEEMTRSVLASSPYGSLGAANQLLALSAKALLHQPAEPRRVRDAVALLSRYQQGDGGWGWWDEGPSQPDVTARVLEALSRARAAGLSIPDSLLQRGVAGALAHYKQTNLWEHRAALISALVLAAAPDKARFAEEVRTRGTHLSPYAQLALAEALQRLSKGEQAAEVARDALKGLVEGPELSYVPAGEHPGWTASNAETTAYALRIVSLLRENGRQERRLAEWLARPETGDWRSPDEEARAAYALAEYLSQHPEPARLGAVSLTVNGAAVPAPMLSGESARFLVPRTFLRSGVNRFLVRREGEGEAVGAVEARLFRPAPDASDQGVQVLRRFEVRNAAGIWEEASGTMPAGGVVRATVVVWPRPGERMVRVTQPLPAGFEYVESEAGAWGREEVRDAAVHHYLRLADEPVSFRYYLRAETAGELAALPAQAEELRRPQSRGYTATRTLRVTPEPAK